MNIFRFKINRMIRLIPFVLLLFFANCICAAEKPPVENIDEVETIPLEDEIPLELDPISITSERFTVKQEAALRMVRQALNREKSARKEDIDELVCWFDRGVGTRIKYLFCARNGDLWAREPDPFTGDLLGGSGNRQVPGYGKILRSSQTMQPGRINKIFNALPGSPDQDDEFVAMALTGKNPPRDLPTEEEMDMFARAYSVLEVLSETGADDDEMESAIEAEGLSLKRYNQLIDLVDHYPSLRSKALERVNALSES